MKFGQLIEYNKRNFFFQKLCRKWGKGSSSRPLFGFSRWQNRQKGIRVEDEEFETSASFFRFSWFLSKLLFHFYMTVVSIIIVNKEKKFQHVVDAQRKFNNAMVFHCSDSISYVTVNDEISARGAYFKISSWQGGA